MKSLVKIIAVFTVLVSVTSCHDKGERNYEFFPNMYESAGYETYTEKEFFTAAQTPVEGTVKRGWLPYEVENTPAGKQFAKDSLVSPLKNTEANLAKGKELYGVYCAICHGKKGKGDGNLVKREKFLGVPDYATRDINEGSTYHVIYYGLNAMGSHAGQLNDTERWQVAKYVTKLRADLKK